MIITIGYSRKDFELGLKRKIQWDTDSTPFIMINEVTGGGKTASSQFILNQLLIAKINEELEQELRGN